MAVDIYISPDGVSAVSQDGAFTNPFSLTFDGRTGGTRQMRLYIRNDDALQYYTNLSLTLQENSSFPIIDNSIDGFAWKLSEGDTQPTEADWANISSGNVIAFSDLGSSGSPDTSTYLPFWVYVQIPPGLDVQVFDRVQFVLSGEENAI